MKVMSLKRLLTVSLLPSILGLLTLGYFSAQQSFETYHRLQHIHNLGNVITSTAHLTSSAVTAEGLLSISYLTSDAAENSRKLKDARQQTEAQLNNFNQW